jgi:hypothetical protein
VDVIASRAILVQWLVHERRIRVIHCTRVKQTGSHEKPDVATISLPEGYPGVIGGRRQRQNEKDRTLGNSPRRRRREDIDITHALELKCTTLSISRPALFFSRPFRVSNQPNIARFSFFFFLVQDRLFLKQVSTRLNITKTLYYNLHQNLTVIYISL